MTMIREYMKNNETVLSNYKMQFLWTFVAFAGLRNKNLGLTRRDDSYSSSGSRDGSSLVIDDENEKNHFVPHKEKLRIQLKNIRGKVGCVFPMVIWSEFRMGQYRDDETREDALHFTW